MICKNGWKCAARIHFSSSFSTVHGSFCWRSGSTKERTSSWCSILWLARDQRMPPFQFLLLLLSFPYSNLSYGDVRDVYTHTQHTYIFYLWSQRSVLQFFCSLVMPISIKWRPTFALFHIWGAGLTLHIALGRLRR